MPRNLSNLLIFTVTRHWIPLIWHYCRRQLGFNQICCTQIECAKIRSTMLYIFFFDYTHITLYFGAFSFVWQQYNTFDVVKCVRITYTTSPYNNKIIIFCRGGALFVCDFIEKCKYLCELPNRFILHFHINKCSRPWLRFSLLFGRITRC